MVRTKTTLPYWTTAKLKARIQAHHATVAQQLEVYITRIDDFPRYHYDEKASVRATQPRYTLNNTSVQKVSIPANT